VMPKVPYLKWRDGRPRWEPGPRLRDQGWRGRDLKGDDGEWLDFPDAIKAAQNINVEAGVTTRIPKTRPNSNAKGFVYFLWSEDCIKIGYSREAFRRIQTLNASSPSGIKAIGIVRGTRADEQRLHDALSASRNYGEWFWATDHVIATMTQSLAQCKPVVAKSIRKNDNRQQSARTAVATPLNSECDIDL